MGIASAKIPRALIISALNIENALIDQLQDSLEYSGLHSSLLTWSKSSNLVSVIETADEDIQVIFVVAGTDHDSTASQLFNSFEVEVKIRSDVYVLNSSRYLPIFLLVGSNAPMVKQRAIGQYLAVTSNLHFVVAPKRPDNFKSEQYDEYFSAAYGPPHVEDNVSFTHFYPSVIQFDRSQDIPVHLYIHLLSMLNDVREDFHRRRAFSGTERTTTRRSSLRFDKGTMFTIIPFMDHCRVTPATSEVLWQDDIEHVQFSLKLTKNVEAGTAVTGRIRVYVGPIVVATLPLGILTGEDSDSPMSEDTNEPYRRIFVSYSHDDQPLVKTFDQLCQRHPHISRIIDYKFMKSGVNWWEEIKKHIERADALELFWSSNSAKSATVEKEWHYALELPRPILPIIFGSPKPPIPKELAHIHFEDLDAYIKKF